MLAPRRKSPVVVVAVPVAAAAAAAEPESRTADSSAGKPDCAEGRGNTLGERLTS